MRSRIVFASFMLGCLLLSGCYPAIGSYYSPAGKYGTPVSEYCHGSIGAKNTMDMKFGNLKLLLSADQIDNTKVFVGLQIFGDIQSIENLNLDNIGVYDEDNHARLEKINIKKVYSEFQKYYLVYTFDIGSVPESFLITLPPFIYQGRQYKDVAVRFTRKHGIWVGTINC